LRDGNGVELMRELRQADPHISIEILMAGLYSPSYTPWPSKQAPTKYASKHRRSRVIEAIKGIAATR
jgi:hypothetical protein